MGATALRKVVNAWEPRRYQRFHVKQRVIGTYLLVQTLLTHRVPLARRVLHPPPRPPRVVAVVVGLSCDDRLFK